MSIAFSLKADEQNNNQINDLLFVYNAKSGNVNMVLDYVHKLVSPDTYECNLCKLTYDNFGRIKKWNHFKNSLDLSIKYYYEDDLIQLNLDPSMELPVILTGDKKLLIDSKEINKCKTVEELIKVLEDKIIN